MASKTIVITGATGYIGSQLLLRLLERHAGEVRCRIVARAASDCTAFEGLPVDIVRADILDPVALLDAFAGADTVFHCAGLIAYARSNRNDLYRVNVTGTRHVVDAALQCGVRRLVLTSSIAAAGASEDGAPVTESASFKGWQHRNGYMESKYLAELEVLRGMAEGLETVMVSPGVVIGRDPANPLSQSSSNEVLRLVHQGRVPFYPKGATGFVDVRDVADALIEAWRLGRPGERYLVVGHNLSFRELFDRLAQMPGSRKGKAVALPSALGLLAGAAGELYALLPGRSSFITIESIRLAARPAAYSNARSREELGIGYRPLEESLMSAMA